MIIIFWPQAKVLGYVEVIVTPWLVAVVPFLRVGHRWRPTGHWVLFLFSKVPAWTNVNVPLGRLVWLKKRHSDGLCSLYWHPKRVSKGKTLYYQGHIHRPYRSSFGARVAVTRLMVNFSLLKRFFGHRRPSVGQPPFNEIMIGNRTTAICAWVHWGVVWRVGYRAIWLDHWPVRARSRLAPKPQVFVCVYFWAARSTKPILRTAVLCSDCIIWCNQSIISVKYLEIS